MAFIFQGNPSKYDIDSYLARYSFVYWSAPTLSSKMTLGDSVFFWRAGKDAGVVASGRISELACDMASVKRPEALGNDLWKGTQDPPDTPKVGVVIDGVRLTLEEGMIPKQALVADDILKNAQIIRIPRMSIFQLTDEEYLRLVQLWSGEQVSTPGQDQAGILEGSLAQVLHRKRERSRLLVEQKKREILDRQEKLLCEVCGRSAQDLYPHIQDPSIFEVHHIVPLSKLEGVVRTTMDDLALLCANCHRIIHGSGDVEDNFKKLVIQFESLNALCKAERNTHEQ